MTTIQITSPVLVQSGNSTPTLPVETTVFIINTAQSYAYTVEGWISLQNMTTSDITTVYEYVAVDGTNYEITNTQQFANGQTQPAFHFPAKMLSASMLYKVTLKQTNGTARAYPYSFMQQQLAEL